MIKTFRHKGLENFFLTGSKAGINPAHAGKLEEQLSALELAREPSAMNFPGWRLHSLRSDLKDHWSVRVNGNWRLTFTFDDGNALLVDYQDYH